MAQKLKTGKSLIDEITEISARASGTAQGAEKKKLTEAERCESAERYRILTEEALIGVYIYSEKQKHYLFVNRAFAEITGYSREELLDLDPDKLLVSEDRHVLAQRGQSIERGESVPIEYTLRIRRKNGEIAHVMSRVHPILYNNEEAFLGHSIDITERKRAEEIQRLQYQIAQAVLTTEDLSELINLIRKELGNVLDTRNFSVALYNKDTDTITLPYFVDEKENFDSFPAKKTLTAYVIRNDRPLLATWRDIHRMIKVGEVEMVGQPAKLWLGVPLKVRGDVIGAIIVQSYTDENAFGEAELEILKFVSSQIGLSIESRRTEQMLRDSVARNQAILEAIPDMMLVLARDGTYIDFKADRDVYLAIPRSEIIGKSIRETGFPEDYVNLILDRINKALDTGRTQPLEYEMKTPNGLLSYEARIVPLNKNEVIAVVRNITPRKRAESELKQSLYKLEATIENTLRAMAKILETRDPYTAGHQQRVAVLAMAIAKEMHLPENQLKGLHIAALIHDIGKIYVPAEILSRPTNLTESEFALLKTHPEVGYKILKNIEFRWPVAEIIVQHHERLDGSGYPRGLKNGEIMLESKILAVADVVEAMLSHRPYRPTRGIKTTLEEIEDNKGILYEPEVVDVCLKLFNERAFKFEDANGNNGTNFRQDK